MKSSLAMLLGLVWLVVSVEAADDLSLPGTLLVDTDGGLALMSPDGVHRQPLGVSAWDFAWSPDSQLIALGDWAMLSVMSWDGTGHRVLHVPGQLCTDLAWSPDGTRIAFCLGDLNEGEVLVIGVDGGGLVNLSNHPEDDRSPTWSFDGQTIAFTSERDGNSEIYRVDPDGGNLRNLTNNPAWDKNPEFSPTQDQLVFASDRGDMGGVFLTDASGADPQLLYQRVNTMGSQYDYREIAWSADGTRIVVLLDIVTTSTYAIDVDTGGKRYLTGGGVVDGGLCWSPDGQYIAFGRQSFGPGEDHKIANNGLYVMRVDGGLKRRIINQAPFRPVHWGDPPAIFGRSPMGRQPVLWGKIKH